MTVPFHSRYLSLVAEIERQFPVADWRSGDVEIWPLARMDLYLDMLQASVGESGPEPALPAPLRALARAAATPALNLWRSRYDLAHWLARPRAAHAVLLGDGVSLDRIDGAWRDRYGEPLIAALEEQGLATFLMQSGDLSRLPWQRPTFAASLIGAPAALAGFVSTIPAQLPGHDGVRQFLDEQGVQAPSIDRARLVRRASIVFATASRFERLLRIVKPTLAFVVTFYAGLGAAYLLACRRLGILSVDLQHCPQEGAHKAYGWHALPERGYGVLPAVFWSWTTTDAAYVRRWTDTLALPWHRSVHGGHTQLAPFLDDADPRTRAWDSTFDAVAGGAVFEREILITLQPVSGFRAQWRDLAAQIKASPARWRWWIRRHPSARAYQDAEYAELVSLRMPNVMVDQALLLPLPALLRRMSVLVSRFSGASAEAAAFGVPALFLSDEARGQFSGLIAQGLASVVELRMLNEEISRVPPVPVRPPPLRQPGLGEVLENLEDIARDYRRLCRDSGGEARHS